MVEQLQRERETRYIISVGLVFADDFLAKALPRNRMSSVDMTGAYVYRIVKPVSGIFVTFGAGGALVPDVPCTKYSYIGRTKAERSATADFMSAVDPESKFGLRADPYHIDMVAAGARLIRRPTDAEIATLHTRNRASKCSPSSRSQREMRALVRRRHEDVSKRRGCDDHGVHFVEQKALIADLFGPDEDDIPPQVIVSKPTRRTVSVGRKDACGRGTSLKHFVQHVKSLRARFRRSCQETSGNRPRPPETFFDVVDD